MPTEVWGSSQVQDNDSRGSTTDGDSLESGLCASQTTLPLQASTPVSTESKILNILSRCKHSSQALFSRIQPVIGSPSMTMLPQKLTRRLLKNMENFKFHVFNAIQIVKSTSTRQVLTRRSATITTESQRAGIPPPAAQ